MTAGSGSTGFRRPPAPKSALNGDLMRLVGQPIREVSYSEHSGGMSFCLRLSDGTSVDVWSPEILVVSILRPAEPLWREPGAVSDPYGVR